MGLDLWQSGWAVSGLKAKARRWPGCGGFGSISIVAGWRGQVCQVFWREIAFVYEGLVDFWLGEGLTGGFWAVFGGVLGGFILGSVGWFEMGGSGRASRDAHS
jgi:hypothetical protein